MLDLTSNFTDVDTNLLKNDMCKNHLAKKIIGVGKAIFTSYNSNDNNILASFYLTEADCQGIK
jgi:hypothetical protein